MQKQNLQKWRILKITKDNIDKYKEFIKNYSSNDPTLYKYISKKNIIGLVDMRFGEEHVNGKLWEFPDIINFGETELIYSEKPKPKPKPKPKTKTKN